ncbi:recombinase family protein [Microbacterium sp. NPDC077057]|uniref:recombinase family protein n=1 Tax=unclassified Microbacterium TaxID=2609290 RepID=UPI0034465D2A
MKRAVLYVRVSRTTEESVSLARQERELRQVAEREGWAVVSVLSDDGVTGTKEREKAEAALAMVAEGRADILISWELSRWSRMGLTAVAKLVGVLQDRPDALLVFHKEGLRSDMPAFGILAAVIAEVARMESEGTRDRIRSMRSHVLSQTDPDSMRWLGGSPPFSYRAVTRPGGGKALVPDPFEVPYARRLMEGFARGDKLTDLTAMLNAEGVPTTMSALRRARQKGEPTDGLNGGLWRITTVRKMLQSPTLLGRTTQRVEVGRRSDGSPVIEYRAVTDAQGIPITRWEPVVDPGLWAQVQERFRKRGPNAPRKAASWLSGLLYCGKCGSVMYANSRKTRNVDTFRCANKAIPGRVCPGVSISRGGVEDHVEGVILRMIGSLKEYKVTERVEGTADTGELDGVAQAIADVQAALGRDGADYGALLPRLDQLKEERRRLLSQPARVVKVRHETGRTLAEAWETGGIAERRFIVDDMLDSINVKPATANGAASVIGDRLEFVWIEHPVEDD